MCLFIVQVLYYFHYSQRPVFANCQYCFDQNLHVAYTLFMIKVNRMYLTMLESREIDVKKFAEATAEGCIPILDLPCVVVYITFKISYKLYLWV
jgi:hypothetical protein